MESGTIILNISLFKYCMNNLGLGWNNDFNIFNIILIITQYL